LTNSNGLYNSFLQAALHSTRGNILLIITRDDLDPRHDMDPDILTELERCGQHLAHSLSSQRRFVLSSFLSFDLR
jgi:hypothetical protein